ncbi:TadE/TadG family type IV pilus assembly protein [Anatilimnocola sp. NA78]|uniref:TadE/TadG family type IV pilus assembly protein n=1 Tax=Anatilimnocola sp. NA78 TaxID=3415683 RepID=UPI003CE4E152
MWNKRNCRCQRRGVAAVEGAIILSALSLLLIGMLELSILLLNHTAMAEGARRVARTAIVRGDRCNTAVEWGPGEITIAGNSDHPAAETLREMLFTLNPAQVQLQVRWLDNDNQAGDRVQVIVQHTHQPIVPAWGWNTGLVLRGSSTMQIAH